ncbi:MAG: PhnD/SsuA/transferrin family substrate-binding protein, partial [Thermodesulfobacteriota bacterium]
LARSEEIAEFNICVSPFLAPPKEELLKRALFSLNVSDARGRQVLESINPEYTAFIPATDQDYDAVRQMLEKLGRGSWK